MGGFFMGVASVAILVLVSTAGCIASKDAPAAAGPPKTSTPFGPRTLTWGLDTCRPAIGIFGVPASKLAAYLPKGFRALSPAEVVAKDAQAPVAAPNPSADGNLGIEMFTCKSGAGLNASVPSIAYGSLFSAVQPPKDLEVPGTKHYFVKWDVLVPDAPRRALLRDAGVPAVDGSAAFSSYMAVGPGVQYAGKLTLGNDSYTFSGLGEVPAADGTFIEYTATPNGLVKWAAQYKFTAGRIGPMDVTVPASGLASKIVGPGVQHGAGFSGTISFTDATIVIPGAT
jgi:hypothetical protein